ncbi:LptF/LptG family permease [Aristophania vespae]|uniref:LptF/LptG family permease n=1 Tax=Aristophania vespae TaxID=2697033 RepID=A0A6P1NG11_9PROT|nr:LptF/LptG family permease [Aristophania vespae]QHI95847.1 LptF/LptG family permease [Aristophania vespae]
MERPFLKLLDQYITKQLLLSLLGLTFGAIALIWLTQSLRFVSLIVQHGLALKAFLHLTLLMIPSFAAIILPVTTFLVILFTYQKLSHDKELVILQSMGLSSLRLARAGLFCGGIATLICYCLTLWLAPASYHAFHRYEFKIRNRIAAFLLEEGVFTTVSPTMTIYIHRRHNENEFYGVLIQDNKNATKPVTIFAERGTLISRPEGPRLVLSNGTRQQLNRSTQKISMLDFKNDTLDLDGPVTPQKINREASELPLLTLLHPPHDTPKRLQNKLKVEGWNRLITPLFTLSYSIIGVVCILRTRFSRHSNIVRPFVAVVLVIALLLFSLMLKNMAERELTFIFFLALEAILPAIIGITSLILSSSSKNRKTKSALSNLKVPM